MQGSWVSPDLVALELRNLAERSLATATTAGLHSAHGVLVNLSRMVASPAHAAYLVSELHVEDSLFKLTSSLCSCYFNARLDEAVACGKLLVLAARALAALAMHGGDGVRATLAAHRRAPVLAELLHKSFSLPSNGAWTAGTVDMLQSFEVASAAAAAAEVLLLMPGAQHHDAVILPITQAIVPLVTIAPSPAWSNLALCMLASLATYDAWLPAIRQCLPLGPCMELVRTHLAAALAADGAEAAHGLHTLAALASDRRTEARVALKHSLALLAYLLRPPALYSALNVEVCLQVVLGVLREGLKLGEEEVLYALSALCLLCQAHARECALGTASSLAWPAGTTGLPPATHPHAPGGMPAMSSKTVGSIVENLLGVPAFVPQTQGPTRSITPRRARDGYSNVATSPSCRVTAQPRGPPLSPRRAAISNVFASVCPALATLVLAAYTATTDNDRVAAATASQQPTDEFEAARARDGSSQSSAGTPQAPVTTGTAAVPQGAAVASEAAALPEGSGWSSTAASMLGQGLSAAAAQAAALAALQALVALAQEARYQQPLLSMPGLMSRLCAAACSWGGPMLHAFCQLMELVAAKCPMSMHDRVFRCPGVVAPLLSALHQEHMGAAVLAARVLAELAHRSDMCTQEILDAGAAGILLDLAAKLSACAHAAVEARELQPETPEYRLFFELAVTLQDLLHQLRGYTAAGQHVAKQQPVVTEQMAKLEALCMANADAGVLRRPPSPRRSRSGVSCAQAVHQSLGSGGSPARITSILNGPAGSPTAERGTAAALARQALAGMLPLRGLEPPATSNANRRAATVGGTVSPAGVATPLVRTPSRHSMATSAATSCTQSDQGSDQDSHGGATEQGSNGGSVSAPAEGSMVPAPTCTIGGQFAGGVADAGTQTMMPKAAEDVSPEPFTSYKALEPSDPIPPVYFTPAGMDAGLKRTHAAAAAAASAALAQLKIGHGASSRLGSKLSRTGSGSLVEVVSSMLSEGSYSQCDHSPEQQATGKSTEGKMRPTDEITLAPSFAHRGQHSPNGDEEAEEYEEGLNPNQDKDGDGFSSQRFGAATPPYKAGPASLAPTLLTPMADGSMVFESVVVVAGQTMRVRSIIKQTQALGPDGAASTMYSFDDQVSPGGSPDTAVPFMPSPPPPVLDAPAPVYLPPSTGSTAAAPPAHLDAQWVQVQGNAGTRMLRTHAASDYTPAPNVPILGAGATASAVSMEAGAAPTTGARKPGVSSSKIDRAALRQLAAMAGRYLDHPEA